MADRQPYSGRVKLGQNFQKSIPSFQVVNVASGLAVEAGLSLTAGLLRVSERIRVMGEARLHAVFGTAQAGAVPAVAAGVLAAAERAGALLMVVLENL